MVAGKSYIAEMGDWSIVPERDLKTLVVKLHDVRLKWRELGVVQEMKPPDLDAIEMNTRGSVERALDEMLSQWLNSAEVRTWPHVIEALNQPNIAKRRLAVQLRKEHRHEYVMEFEDKSNGGRGGSNSGSGGSNGGNHSGNSGTDKRGKPDPVVPVKRPCD